MVQLKVTDGTGSRRVNLKDTLLVPDLRTNPVSVSKITNRGDEVLFWRQEALVIGIDGTTKMVADRVGDLYYLLEDEEQAWATTVDGNQTELGLWHRRLGHLNSRDLVEMSRKHVVEGVDIGRSCNLLPCDTCMKGKLSALKFPDSTSRSATRLDIVHTDLCGSMRVLSKRGAHYMVTFVGDCTRWCEVHFVKRKSDVLGAFKEFKVYAEKQTGEKIKNLQSDNGKEFCNGEFDAFLKAQGIRRRITVPYTPQQNGVVERKNRTLVEMARCMLFEAKLAPSFWAEAVHA